MTDDTDDDTTDDEQSEDERTPYTDTGHVAQLTDRQAEALLRHDETTLTFQHDGTEVLSIDGDQYQLNRVTVADMGGCGKLDLRLRGSFSIPDDLGDGNDIEADDTDDAEEDDGDDKHINEHGYDIEGKLVL
jgi:hypothetical protein